YAKTLSIDPAPQAPAAAPQGPAPQAPQQELGPKVAAAPAAPGIGGMGGMGGSAPLRATKPLGQNDQAESLPEQKTHEEADS
ncbi:MAG: hypothetical protein VX803_10420, partial [Pseudomonadota bacterium]|nr:hypothetical protein [Pseudomonadota bacterium]